MRQQESLDELYWLALEYKQCATGAVPESRDMDHSLYISQNYFYGSPRKSEALALQGHSDPWLELRMLVTRGRLAEASARLSRLEAEGLHAKPSALCEIVSKRARVSGYQGQWAETLRYVQLARSLNPPLQTRLTLHQMAGLAHFELGDMSSAVNEADMFDSLATVLPFAPTTLYNRVLKAKIAARDQGAGTGKRVLRQLWREAEEKQILNADLAVTLLRLEVDLRRLAGEEHCEPAYASYLLAEAMGDGIYGGLGLLDLFFSLTPGCRGPYVNALTQFAEKYKKVGGLLTEIESASGQAISTTAQSISSYRRSCEGGAVSFHDKSNYKTIVHLSYGIAIDLESLQVRSFSSQKQAARALLCLSSSQGTKSTLFECIWGRKFTPHLHDTVIRNLIYRLRKQIGVDIRCEGSEYTLVNCLVIK